MSRLRTSRPRLNPLEGRDTPSCLVYVQQDTLVIRGDDLANDVRVAAEGGRVSVTCDRDPAVTYDGIRRIAADLAGGPDHFTMSRTPGPAPLSLRLSAGAADDVVNLDWAPGGSDSVWVDLGDDHDRFDARLIPPPDPEVPEVSVTMTVLGVAGLDRITSRMGIQPTPFTPSTAFEFVADGGEGNDVIAAEADVLPAEPQQPVLPQVPPSARFAVSLQGGAGDDEITARIGIEPTPFVPVVDFVVGIDGGDGNDAVAVNTQIDPGSLVGFNPQPEPPVLNIAIGVRGGAGLDRITSRMGIQPTPFLPPAIDVSLRMDGGTGNDLLDAQFEADATQQKVADLQVALSGGDGNDSLRLTWTPGIAFDVDAFADGGAGIDTGVFSPGVRHVNVERLG
jgi:hypothetical protein